MATAMVSVPTVVLSEVACGLEGEEGDVMEGDIVTCSARVVLTRPSHSHTGFHPPIHASSQRYLLFPRGDIPLLSSLERTAPQQLIKLCGGHGTCNHCSWEARRTSENRAIT